MGCMGRKGKAAVCAQCDYFDQGPENPQQLPPRTVLEENYVIGRALGQGGFGITYLAWDLELNKKLAIKEHFPLHISTRAQDHLTVSPISYKSRTEMEYGLEKFAEEAKALSHFKDHPGIVNILDFLHANGTAFIVMVYVEGRDLKQYLIQRGGKISFEAGLKFLFPLMTALEDIHRYGIVHRDISPDNIYVQENGAVKILDFGATRYAMGEQSRSLSVVLKPGYAPEEQYRSRGKQGPWTDIYALGATFYRTITGKVPPEATDRMAEDDLEMPSRLGVAVPSSSEAALMKALAVKAENRFQNVTAFRKAMMPARIGPLPAPAVAGPVLVAPVVEKKPGKILVEHEAHSVRLPKVWLLTTVSVLLLILFVATIMQGSIWGPQVIIPVILFGVMVFVLAQMWKSIQDGHARTTPENAVAYCFIPGFNLYWVFEALWGFAKDYNGFRLRHARAGQRLNESMFLMASIAIVAGTVLIPFAGSLASLLVLVNACFLLPVVAMICDAVNGLGVDSPSDAVTQEKLFCLRGISGEYQGQDVDVEGEGIVIGRNPSRANIVLLSDEVSGRHVRVWPDAANAGIWLEDLNSTNGTFCRQGKSSGGADWVRVAGKKLLRTGDRFRLSESGAAEFEVRAG